MCARACVCGAFVLSACVRAGKHACAHVFWLGEYVSFVIVCVMCV